MKIETKLISFPEGIVLKSGDKLDSFDLMVEIGRASCRERV